jgi:putative membrane protein
MKKKVLLFMPLAFSAIFCLAQDTTTRPVDTTAGGGGVATAEDSMMMDTRINPGSLHKKDVKFLVEAASSSQMEIVLGQIAQQKATSTEVKNYAAMMVNDHTKAIDDLKMLVSNKGASIPDTILPKHRALMDRLNGVEGADFDKAYMSVMRDAHENDIDEFEDQAKDAKDPDVKAFAAKRLPVLQEHHKQAKDAKSTMNNNSGSDQNKSSNSSGSSGASGNGNQ